MIGSKAETTCEILRSDHQKIEELLNQAGPEEVARNLKSIAQELDVHMRFEEELVYPAAREALKNKDKILDEFMRDNDRIKKALAKLKGVLPSKTGEFLALFDDLKQLVLNHFKKEEHRLIPKIKKSPLDTVKGQLYSGTH